MQDEPCLESADQISLYLSIKKNSNASN